jgi:hypothetical protein
MKLQHIIPALLFLLPLAGCGEFFNQIVDVDIPEHEPLLAVSAHFQAQDTALTVFVSRSVGILDPVQLDTVTVPGAAVTVLRDGEVWQTLAPSGSGFFRVELGEALGDGAHTYTVRATAPGFEAAEGRQAMPTPPSILNAAIVRLGGVDENGTKVNTLDVEFQDPPGEENYYLLEAFAFARDSFLGDYYFPVYPQSNDPLVEYNEQGLIFKDGPIDGKRYTLKAYFYDFFVGEEPGGKVLVRLHAISRDRYLFLLTLDLYNNAQNNPFAEPVVVHNNIEGGVGIFGVSAVGEVEVEY